MRLLLTSNGFPKEYPKLRQAFVKLVKKPIGNVYVAFIPTASVVEDDRSFMEIDRKEIEEMGVPAENITNLEIDHEVALEELSKYDVIFVDGGNTFYLLEKVREFGFDKVIKEYLEKDLGVYVGVSAGTVLMGPDINFVESWDDKSKATLKNTKGLAYTEEGYSPHYKDEEKEMLDKWRERVRFPIKELRDGQAVIINGDTREFVE